MSIRMMTFVAAAAFASAACAPDSEPTAPAPAPAPPVAPAPAPAPEPTAEALPERIDIERGGFIPEGIEYDRINERFLTGSLADGTIYEIGTDGSMTPFVTDSDLVSSVGIEVDEAGGRLIAANSNSAVFQGQAQGHARVGVYSLSSGERLAMVELGELLDAGDDAAFFANDVTVADDGTIYVTDTMQNVIYAVDPAYEASVFHRFEGREGPSLNGIEYHADGYLLVVVGAEIHKVPLANPAAAAAVSLPEPMAGADGIVFDGSGRLHVVSNSDSRVVALASSDGWESAVIDAVAAFDGQATTGAVVGDDIYVVQPHFADQDPPTILRANFD